MLCVNRFLHAIFSLCVMHVASCLVVFSICFLQENWREIDRFSFTELFWTVLNIWNLSRGGILSSLCEEFKFSLRYLANCCLCVLFSRILSRENCSILKLCLLSISPPFQEKKETYLYVWFANTNTNCILPSCFSCSVMKLVDDFSQIRVWNMFVWPYEPLFTIEYSRTRDFQMFEVRNGKGKSSTPSSSVHHV